MGHDHGLTEYIRGRFGILDDWIIHYQALPEPSPESTQIFLALLDERAVAVKETGLVPALLIDLRHTKIIQEKEIVRILTDAIYASHLHAVAAYGVSHPVTKVVFTVAMRQGKRVPGKFFVEQNDAMMWLRKVVPQIPQNPSSSKTYATGSSF